MKKLLNKKVIFVLIIIILIAILLIHFISKSENLSSSVTKIYSTKDNEINTEDIWCESFQLAWNELISYVGSEIEFEEDIDIVDKLNNRSTNTNILSNGYYVKVGKGTEETKQIIYTDIQEKFGKDISILLDDFSFQNENGILIYSIINKEFNFLEEFDNLGLHEFGNTGKYVNCFGIDKNTNNELLYKNVEVMYYEYNWNISTDYAVRLNTKEGEEIILYYTTKEEDLDSLYDEVINLENEYEGDKEFGEYDYVTIPNIDFNVLINYDELCGKTILGTNGEYLENAIQEIELHMDYKGGSLKSESSIKSDVLSGTPAKARKFDFCKPCYMFIKEDDAKKPYFSMKIDLEFLDYSNM